MVDYIHLRRNFYY